MIATGVGIEWYNWLAGAQRKTSTYKRKKKLGGEQEEQPPILLPKGAAGGNGGWNKSFQEGSRADGNQAPFKPSKKRLRSVCWF